MVVAYDLHAFVLTNCISLSLFFLRIRPDRTPHPGLSESKKVCQPFSVEIVNTAGVLLGDGSGMCRVDLVIYFTNRFEHVENLLDVLKFDWVAQVNGETVCEGYDLGCGNDGICKTNEEKERSKRGVVWPEVLITFHVTPISPRSDLIIRIMAYLRHDRNWASCGYPMGFEELLLRPQIVPEAYYMSNNNTEVVYHNIPLSLPLSPGQRANLVEDHHNGLVVLSAGMVEASFNSSSGDLASFSLSGHELLYRAPDDKNNGDDFLLPLLTVQLLRAPTDNDRGGYINQWNAVGLSLTKPLQRVGKPSLTCRVCDGGASAMLTVHQDWEPTDEDMEKNSIFRMMSQLNNHQLAMSAETENNNAVNSTGLQPRVLVLKDLSLSGMSFVGSLIMSWRLGFHIESTNCIKVWVRDRTLNSTIENEDMDIAGIEDHFGSSLAVSPHIINDDAVSVSHPPPEPVREGHTTTTSTRVEIKTEYHLSAETGVFRITCSGKTPTWWPPLPRVGLRLLLSDGYEDVEWFGRGPDECYPDRCSAAYTGLCLFFCLHLTWCTT